MLLKFFSNSNSTAYLRELADEFGESTNSIRLELNKLTKAGYLQSTANGRTIQYRANTEHKLFPEIKTIVYKYLGIDTIIEDVVNKVVSRLGKVLSCFIIGDYANGKDSGIIDIIFVGDVDLEFLGVCVKRAENLIHRKIRTLVLSPSEFESNKGSLKVEKAILLWGEK